MIESNLNDISDLVGEAPARRPGRPPKARDTYDDINPQAKASTLGNKPERVTARTRVPMSIPAPKLAVPDIPGYHLHWILNDPARINQAMRAGYEFVSEDEVDVANTNLAGDMSTSGNTDMGSRVSVLASGSVGDDGKEQRLYLMKLPQEWWEEDQAKLEAQNENIAASLRGGGDASSNPHGQENRYIPEGTRRAMASMFTPKRR